MRKVFLATHLTSIALAQSALAEDAPPIPEAPTTIASWYLRNEIGGNLIPSISIKDRTFLVGADTVAWSGASLSMDGGVGWNIAGGWHVNDWLALEISTGIAYNEFSSVSGSILVNGSTVAAGSTSIDGSLLQVPVLVGPRAEIPLGEKLRLNLGFSLGGIYLHGDLDSSFAVGAATVTVDGSDGSWAFAYSATAGLDWEIAPNLGLGVAYRFLGTTSASFGPNEAIEGEGVYNQQILATLTVRF
jgi:opacity protein-like surface antigen